VWLILKGFSLKFNWAVSVSENRFEMASASEWCPSPLPVRLLCFSKWNKCLEQGTCSAWLLRYFFLPSKESQLYLGSSLQRLRLSRKLRRLTPGADWTAFSWSYHLVLGPWSLVLGSLAFVRFRVPRNPLYRSVVARFVQRGERVLASWPIVLIHFVKFI